MSLFITSLNSGSNGNCYYLGNSSDAVLIDAGISCREIESRMKRLGLSIKNIKAVFISHEHTDHIKGLPMLTKKYQLPVYITSATMKSGGICLEDHLINSFIPHQVVEIGSLSVTPFPKFHDAEDPYSFVVQHEGVCVGVFTDIGKPCDNLKKYFAQCHAAFLEANYDEQMLENGDYPIHLKRRIRGGNGHLGNIQALELFLDYRSPFMTHLILSHLSKNNNSPELVQSLFNAQSENVNITVASRYKESEVFQIDKTVSGNGLIHLPRSNNSKPKHLQLSLHFE